MTPKRIAEWTQGRFFYLASPYSLYPGGINVACSDICKIAGRLIAEDINIFCPISHSHTIAVIAGMDPIAPEPWIRLDHAIASQAYGLIVANMSGWESSLGIKAEIGWFRAMRKSIWLLDCETLEMTPITQGAHS